VAGGLPEWLLRLFACLPLYQSFPALSAWRGCVFCRRLHVEACKAQHCSSLLLLP
jgi:hypothetical protein